MQLDGKTLEPQTRIEAREHEKVGIFEVVHVYKEYMKLMVLQRYGAKTWILYRPDLHSELRRLAMDPNSPFPVPELVLGSKVVAVVSPPSYHIKTNPKYIQSPESGTVSLEDGTTHLCDLIIGADGQRVRPLLTPFPQISDPGLEKMNPADTRSPSFAKPLKNPAS